MSEMQKRLLGMLEQGHDNLLLRFGLGKAYTEDQQPEAAIEHLRQAVTFDASHASSWFWLGRAYMDAGQLDKAQDAFDKAAHHAQEKGEQQTVKMVEVFARRLAKQKNQG